LHQDFDEIIWYQMRIISILLCTLLLGLAIYLTKDILYGNFYFSVMIALTPFVSYLAGSVNPSGLEIVSAISLSILISGLFLRQSRNCSPSPYLYAAIFVTGMFLSLIRPMSWLIALFLFVVYLLISRKFDKFHLIDKIKIFSCLLFPIFLGYLQNKSINTLRGGTSNLSLPVSTADISSFGRILQEQFVGFDNHIYRAIGEFGYLDHRGLELVNTFWSVFFYLTFIFALFRVNWPYKFGLSLALLGGIALAPLLAFHFILGGSYGYQSRYAMAIICSIPIISGLNENSNVFRFFEFRKILVWFIPISLISDWSISVYRFSHGLPFKVFNSEDEFYFWWLGRNLSLALFALILGYLLLSINLIKHEARAAEN
jgi:hypothetical protein